MDDEVCEHCGRLRLVMIAMKPGSDDKPWRLCLRCWIDGLRSMDGKPLVTVAPEPAVPAKPKSKSRKAS